MCIRDRGNKVKLEYRKNKYPLEVYVLYIGEELLRKLSDEETRLDEAFDFVPVSYTHLYKNNGPAITITVIKIVPPRLLKRERSVRWLTSSVLSLIHI